jgi:hypothetical protein
MFPTDPNAPGGLDRSDRVRRYYADRRRLPGRFRLFALEPPRAAGGSGWPPVRQLTPLGSAAARGEGREAA